MSKGALTELQWWRRAKRHEMWLAAMGDKLDAIGADIERLDDAQALQRCAARAQAIAKRIARLQRVMQRHFERAPDMRADIPTGHLVMRLPAAYH